jgi:hypothetical protein
MKRYLAINPLGEIIHVLALDQYEARHKAARIDQFKFQPNQYNISIYNPKK